MTAQQLLDLSNQYVAMAQSVEDRRKIDRNPELRILEQQLLNEAAELASTSIFTTLDAMEPHYDGMLSVIRDLKAEITTQEKLERITHVVDTALAIAAAVRSGNIALLTTSVNDATQLLKYRKD